MPSLPVFALKIALATVVLAIFIQIIAQKGNINIIDYIWISRTGKNLPFQTTFPNDECVHLILKN